MGLAIVAAIVAAGTMVAVSSSSEAVQARVKPLDRNVWIVHGRIDPDQQSFCARNISAIVPSDDGVYVICDSPRSTRPLGEPATRSISLSPAGPVDGAGVVSCVAVLIASKDGAATIGETVASVRSQPGVDVYVVSDGSSDDTVEQARRAGAEVLELVENVGKPGVRH